MGAAVPLNVTWALARVGITLPLLSKLGPQPGLTQAVPSVKLRPKIAAIEPGARNEEVSVKLAPLTTELGESVGLPNGEPTATLTMKASVVPESPGWKGFTVGKSEDPVTPVTYAFPEASATMARAVFRFIARRPAVGSPQRSGRSPAVHHFRRLDAR